MNQCQHIDALAVGNRLAAARDSLGMTQEEVAKALGIELSTYRHYEKGRHMIPTVLLCLLPAVLRRPITYFLGLPDERGLEADEQTLIGLYRELRPGTRRAVLELALRLTGNGQRENRAPDA